MKYDFTSILDRRGKDAVAIDAVGAPGSPYPAPRGLASISWAFLVDSASDNALFNILVASWTFIASTYDPYDMIIRDGIYPGGRK